MKKDFEEITEKYAGKIAPHLELAKRAYGLRGQATPAHVASAKYTELVKEYYAKGGSLVALASKLGVAYSNNVLMISVSTWEAMTAYQEKRGSKQLGGHQFQ